MWLERKSLSILLATVMLLSNSCAAFSAERGILMPEIKYQPTTTQQTFTIGEAVDLAIRNFPTIANARFRLYAARAGVTLAKTAYLPNVNLVAQEYLTTHNVLTGVVLSQASTLDAIPIQSGKPSTSTTMAPIWGSNQAANFNWLLYDFGMRHANVQLARADTKLAANNVKLTELDVAYACADSFLTTVAAQQTVVAQEAVLDRMRAAQVQVNTLVNEGLRPGVDASRADFDVADARIGVIQAERATELAKVDLAERMGIAGSHVEVIAGPLIRRPVGKVKLGPTNFETHPLTQVNQAAVRTWAAKVHLIDRTWYPHLYWNSAMIGRGSSIGGEVTPVAGGFLPQVANYVAGMQISFPVMDIFAIKAQRKAALANEYAERANLDLAIQILEQKDARARVLLTEAKKIAAETPRLVEAARENEIKILERYKAGLTNMVAVADAEKMLAKAEVEDELAQIEVWRSILAIGYVQGDLKPFLTLVSYAEGAQTK